MLYSTLVLAAVAGSAVAAPVMNARYKQDILEDYDSYHLRYIALNCHEQHNTTFFGDCCRPVRAGENATEVLSDYCAPNATALESAASRIANRVTATISGAVASGSDAVIDDADDAWCNATESAAVSGYSAPTKAPEGAPTPTEAATSAEVTSTEAPSAPAPSSEAEQQVETQAAWAKPQEQKEAPSSSEEAPASSSTEAEKPKPTHGNNDDQDNGNNDNQDNNNQGNNDNNNQGNNDNNNNNNGGAPSGGDWIDGTASWYFQSDGTAYSGQAAACGTVYQDSDRVVALPASHGFDTGRQGRGCNAQVTIRHKETGKVVTAQAVDACPSCGPNQIDLSRALFAELGDYGTGILPIEWQVAA